MNNLILKASALNFEPLLPADLKLPTLAQIFCQIIVRLLHSLLFFLVSLEANLPNYVHYLQTIMLGSFLLLPFQVSMQVGVGV